MCWDYGDTFYLPHSQFLPYLAECFGFYPFSGSLTFPYNQYYFGESNAEMGSGGRKDTC